MHRASATTMHTEPASLATGGPPPAPRPPARAIQRADLLLDVFVLFMTAGIVVASIILTPGDHAVSLMGVELPPTCTFKRLTGMDCFGCGLTRSFTYMGHGEVRHALSRHMLGPALFIFTTAQIPYRIIQIVRRLRAW